VQRTISSEVEMSILHSGTWERVVKRIGDGGHLGQRDVKRKTGKRNCASPKLHQGKDGKKSRANPSQQKGNKHVYLLTGTH